jgi:uncharacterized protein
MKNRINFLTIGVADLKQSIKFYTKTLGFPLFRPVKGDIAFLKINNGTMVLALYPKKLLAEDAKIKKIAGKGFGGITLAHNVSKKSDVDKTLNEIKKKGGKILKPAADAFWGGRSGYFADPDGTPWEVAWNPFIKFGADGKIRFIP